MEEQHVLILLPLLPSKRTSNKTPEGDSVGWAREGSIGMNYEVK